MSNIAYTYEIVSVDEQAKCMEVEYSSEGYQTMRVGARLPFEGESLDSVIRSFAPVQTWAESSLSVTVPSVGHRGSFDPTYEVEAVLGIETEEQKQARLNAEMWAKIAFEKQVAEALVKFGVLAVDPTSIEVTKL
jgi:hypothetical protein